MGNNVPDKESKDEIIENIIDTAKSYIGETYWAKDVERVASLNEKVCFEEGEWKCNLFVYEVILEAGYDIGCPNRKHFYNILRNPRPPTTHDWYNQQIRNFNYIGEGNEGKRALEEGDIITDNTHMGIASYNRGWKTISAGKYEVLENDWGIERSANPIRIFRYAPGYNLWPETPHVIW